MDWKSFSQAYMRRIIAVVDWVEGQRRKSPAAGRHGQLLHPPIREFVLYTALDPQGTAWARPLEYIGDGDTCQAADFTWGPATSMFKVGGGAMLSMRLEKFAAGTRGHCVKYPGRKWWTIIQMDCQPKYF